MTRHLELEAILPLAIGMNMRRTSDQKPTLSLAWALDAPAGKPIARWIALTSDPCGALEGV
jgi:hypothetical protein